MKKIIAVNAGPRKGWNTDQLIQVKDYSKYNWTMFNPEAKQAHHDETFNNYLAKAYELGSQL